MGDDRDDARGDSLHSQAAHGDLDGRRMLRATRETRLSIPVYRSAGGERGCGHCGSASEVGGTAACSRRTETRPAGERGRVMRFPGDAICEVATARCVRLCGGTAAHINGEAAEEQTAAAIWRVAMGAVPAGQGTA